MMISDEIIAEVRAVPQRREQHRELVDRVRRLDVRAILRDPALRRELMVAVIIATQAREGIETTRAQAERAYDEVCGR